MPMTGSWPAVADWLRSGGGRGSGREALLWLNQPRSAMRGQVGRRLAESGPADDPRRLPRDEVPRSAASGVRACGDEVEH